MQRNAFIDISNCRGTIVSQDDDMSITQVITLSEVKIEVFSKIKQVIETEEIITYDYNDREIRQKFSPLIYWMISGLHGIPMDKRNG